MLVCLQKKSATQPLENFSAGSVFKRFFVDEKNSHINSKNFIDNNPTENENHEMKSNNNYETSQIIPAKLIDELGLKGLFVGGAMVSKKHAGFIINTGNATSQDGKNLIELINEKVKSIYGFTLPLEIEIVN